jgi:non-specific serine/threonine protein kinase
MTDLAKLVADYRDNTLQLSELFDAVEARGALPVDQHYTEITWLEQLRSKGDIDPEIATLLTKRLRALQQDGATDALTHVDTDAGNTTVMRPEDSRWSEPTDAPTKIQTLSSHTSRTNHDDVTVVKPSSQRTSRTTGTNSEGSVNNDSWRRVATAEGGPVVRVGMMLKGRFLLERELGRGGMGVVFLARDERKVEARDRDPYVAVKVLNDEFRRHPDSLIALQREARRAQQLAHDNIVHVYDFDKDNAIVFMTMEYIDGTDLRSLIRNSAHRGMALDKAWPLIDGMAQALERAHVSGVVHSDFKPGNVMVDKAGVPKVFDFGIARAGKHTGEGAGDQTVFDAGTLGALTPSYASLEMLQGKEPSPSDDVYALGCVTFELLTGRHPFDKASAEVAMKEGRRPPLVPGLGKRQYATLCKSVAFTADKRLSSASELVEGLRERNVSEYVTRYAAYGVLLLAALFVIGLGLFHYKDQHQATSVMAGFQKDDPHYFADEDRAFQALSALPINQRQQLVVDQSSVIQDYLLDRIHNYWDPAHGRTNYAGVEHVLHVRDELKLFSPSLDMAHSDAHKQRNLLLNELDTQLSQRIDANAIFQDQPDNAVDTMARIRAIDPDSELLKNPELEFKYDDDIGQLLDAGKMDEAKRRLAQASSVFPDSVKLKEREKQLAMRTASAAKPAVTSTAAPATASSAPAASSSVSVARSTLTPSVTTSALGQPQWQQSAVHALTALHNDDSPQTRTVVTNFCNSIASQIATVNDPTQLSQGVPVINACAEDLPQSPILLAQQTRLQAMAQQLPPPTDPGAVNAEVATLIQSLRQASAANDTKKAQDALARIRALQPSNPILVTEGPLLVANAYLGLAEESCERGKWKDAVNLVTSGMTSLGNRQDLQNAQQRYQLVIDMMQARGRPLSDTDYQHFSQRLADVQNADEPALKKLEAGMAQQGKLPQGSLSGLLTALKDNTAAPPNAKANGRDPCGLKGMAGTGRVCFDTFSAGAHGPAMVVIPGLSGGRPYAMSRNEVSVSDFNLYCSSTNQCDSTSSGEGSGNAPVRNITFSDAKAYAAWLTQSSGYTYRIPTNGEWTHAADANSGWKRAEDSDCAVSSQQHHFFTKLFAEQAPNPSRGQEGNPWGLLNMSGGVWEWVTSDAGLIVRGGSFKSPWSECTVDSQRTDDGSRQSDVGFRLVRELK